MIIALHKNVRATSAIRYGVGEGTIWSLPVPVTAARMVALALGLVHL